MKHYQAFWLMVTWVTLFINFTTLNTTADCPQPYLNTGIYLTPESQNGTLGYGTGPECCMYTLSAFVAFKLAPGDRVNVHGLHIINDGTVTLTSFR